MSSKFDDFWLGILDDVHQGILRAINENEIVRIDVSDIKIFGKRKSWYGVFYLDSSGYKKADMAHAKALGKLLASKDYLTEILKQNNIRIQLTITKLLD